MVFSSLGIGTKHNKRNTTTHNDDDDNNDRDDEVNGLRMRLPRLYLVHVVMEWEILIHAKGLFVFQKRPISTHKSPVTPWKWGPIQLAFYARFPLRRRLGRGLVLLDSIMHSEGICSCHSGWSQVACVRACVHDSVCLSVRKGSRLSGDPVRFTRSDST